MNQLNFRIFAAGLFIVLFLGIFSPTFGDSEPCQPWVGQLVSRQGAIEVRKMGQSQWQPARLNDTFCPGDSIRVGQLGRAAVRLPNDTLLRLDELTAITFPAGDKEKHTLIEILKGAVYFFSHHPTGLKVVTPFVSAAIEGTEFLVKVEKAQTFLSVFEGRVAATNHLGGIALAKGQSAVAQAGNAPELRIVVRPRDAVQWALYYMPVMYVPPGQTPKEDVSDPRFLVYRASQLLAVGRVDATGADIERALSLDPKYSDAFALQSIIALVQNEKDKAFSFAQKAVEAGPHSATARIAMSYAQQARFDLESARASVEEAVRLEPDNTLAWARLAELWSSFGRLGKALVAAKKAVELNPSLSRTQMVLGFAYLTQVKTTESRTAFEKAIELDQADPLSRLGLGLAKIRDGDLQAGGREIETAASLDPNNSLVRSYLGKVYFEEKRTGLDEREYAIAKELDPNDPTPWFYDAIAKQTTNRPVEALHDLQKAIELNDNRAVYRSKLMLDADEAARSASLARIYSDLGFQQRALVEGWQSVNTDPSNFSAHRFLADSYAVRPRHEIARVSELLQSQLLQPLNITPIQPRLAESNLFLLSGGGPARLSFNEFNPLFNRNRIAVLGSGLVGENDTYGGEGVVSGIYNRLSMSAGYTQFETDGWRDNADQTDKIANVFAQYELTYKTSIQAEYRYRDNEHGDLQQRFFEDEFLPNYEENEEKRSIRLGFHHAFAPGSDLIGNFQYAKDDFSLHNEIPNPDFIFPIINYDLKADDVENFGSELSYLFRSKHLNLVSGAGYFDIDSKDEFTVFFEFPTSPPLVLDQIEADNDAKHTNLYAYSYVKPMDNLTLTVGASYDDFNPEDDNEFIDKNQFNPKFGISWNPFQNTTLRAAAFRVLKRTLITDQTLEPTQVAGFNQFFDEIGATDYWVYGGALDQKFTKVFLGAEYTHRDLDVPFRPATGLTTVDWDEQIFRSYLFWTPHKWLALNAEYIYEDFDRDKNYNLNAKTLETHYFPLGINFFHPCGISASLKGTYVDQEGSFNRLEAPTGVTENGQDDFWLFDAAIRYRFPKRYGFLTVGVSNLTDEDFEYFDTDRDNPRIQPDRFFFVKLTLALP